MMLLELTLTLLLAPAAGEDVLVAASKATQAKEFARATEMCLELAALQEIDAQTRGDALFAALGNGDMAYEETGDMIPLCRAYASLVDFGSGDVLALKPRVEHRLESIAGPSWRSFCFPVEEAPAPPPVSAPLVRPSPIAASSPEAQPAASPVPPAVVDAPRSKRSRQLVISGATLVSLGAASLAGMTAALYQWNLDSNELESIAEGMISPEELVRARELDERTKLLKPLAITTGTFGVVSTITGVALLIVGSRRRARKLSLQPVGGPRFMGAFFQGSF
jgi:hypothetical protein